MFVQYAACFGVELTVNNTAAGYFSNEFGLSTTKAGMVAALFGLMNLFARSLGGVWSGERAQDLTRPFEGVGKFHLLAAALLVIRDAERTPLLLASPVDEGTILCLPHCIHRVEVVRSPKTTPF